MSLEYLMTVISGIKRKLDSLPDFRWATASSVSGKKIRITLDGETSPVAADTINLAGDLSVGDRVFVMTYNRRVFILGFSRGERGISGGHSLPVGSVVMYTGSGTPAGWLECDGRSYSESEYPALYQALSATGGRVTTPSQSNSGLTGFRYIIKSQ